MASANDIDLFSQRVYRFLINALGFYDGKVVWYAGQKIFDLQERALYYANVVKDVQSMLDGQQSGALKEQEMYRWMPVSIGQFIDDPYYMNKKEDVYPAVRKELVKINSGKFVEVVCTGGIGSGKTTVALYTNAYQLYLMSCLREPHKLFGQDSAAEILLIFQSINAHLAKTVDFARFKAMIQNSLYFKEKFPFKKDVESRLVFPNRIEVVPVSGQETAAIGQNVIGGLIDELNFMQVVEKSKQSVDKGTYDQAVAVYNSIARRRKSRFMTQGKLPGILCLVSSKRYPGQFTDQKEEEAKKDPTIYVYDKRVWEIKPEGTFSGETFRVYVGDETHKPRLLLEGETVEEKKLVMEIPVEYQTEFEKDIINSLRDIAGVSTLAHHPFMLDVDAVANCFGKHASIFSQEAVDFVDSKLGLYPQRIKNPKVPRFAHIDLAITGDSAGLVIGCVTEFVNMKAIGFGNSEQEFMPNIRIDGILEVKPPKNGEILFWKIRKILTDLKQMGMLIKWVTFDSFQSRDSMQLLRQSGFITGLSSVDIKNDPYECLKSALYSGRIVMPMHEKCRKELVSLEKDTKTGKIDHPPNGSKDCADALAGVVYGLTTRREIWAMHQIPLFVPQQSVPKLMGPEPVPERCRADTRAMVAE